MLIVVGLGNFGDRYAYTYHNLGYLTVEALADRIGFKFKKRDCDCLVSTGFIGGEEIIIAKPLTYMNLSGKAVYQLMRKYKAEPSDFVIVYDDIDIEKGKLRIRNEGSAGTHNGMRNIIEVTGRQDFPRVRVGFGPTPEFVPLADYVLSEIPKSERQLFADVFGQAVDHLVKVIKEKKQ